MADILRIDAEHVTLRVRVDRADFDLVVAADGCKAYALKRIRESLPWMLWKLAELRPGATLAPGADSKYDHSIPRRTPADTRHAQTRPATERSDSEAQPPPATTSSPF